MLEADYRASKDQSDNNMSAKSLMSLERPKMVTWRRFHSKYWPHLPQMRTFGQVSSLKYVIKLFMVSPTEAYLVFAEFMGKFILLYHNSQMS